MNFGLREMLTVDVSIIVPPLKQRAHGLEDKMPGSTVRPRTPFADGTSIKRGLGRDKTERYQ